MRPHYPAMQIWIASSFLPLISPLSGDARVGYKRMLILSSIRHRK